MKKNVRIIVALVLAGIAWSAYLDHQQQPRPLPHPCRVVQDTQGHQYVGNGCPQ